MEEIARGRTRLHSLTILIAASLLLVAVSVACIVRVLQKRGEVGVRCSLELTPQDGWRLLNLAVVNRHDTKVWVERAAFVITNLNANMPSGAPNERGSIEIREFVRSGEDLCVSLIEAVYNAAGKPQGVYSFLCRCAVRYRLAERWLESESPVFRVEMVRLSGMRVRRVPAGGRATRVAVNATDTQPLLVTNEASRTEESRRSAAESQSSHASLRP